ncbi:FliG C-terminal domain-containing protein [Leptospira perolatii]|uniref:FliG C-terminal domain-containing protein n=1 Tax=Leptospira perolatii TaxID=2023191 RepID=UPI000F634195|nr:FliG C-terminal domain-containing protein [Leptospira perolatii]
MSHGDKEDLTLKTFEEISYFDNLALYYLCNETPPQTLALAFLIADKKVCGSMLGVMEPKRREFVHELMAKQKDAPEEKKTAAAQGLLIIAENLLTRNLVRKQGKYYYGVKKD